MELARTLPTQTRRTFLLGVSALVIAGCTDSDSAENATSAGTATETTGADTTATSSTAGPDDTSESGGAESTIAGGDDEEITPVALTPAMFEALPVCTLTAAANEGPFPTNSPLDRREIHEGYPGHPLRLGVRVVDQNCEPIPGAMVDIWHADASGDYSEYTDDGSGKDEGEGSSFCRGIQTANDDGILEFLTIYPGWYEGRAVHIHASVHIDNEIALTTQLYFDEAYSEAIYATGEYAQFGSPDTPWTEDRLIGDPSTDGSIITLAGAPTTIGEGTLGLVNLGLQA